MSESGFPEDYFLVEGASERPQRRKSRSDAVKEPRELSPEKLEQRAKNILLHQLSRQAKSEHQLREVLTQREIPDEIIDKVIVRFSEAGLIDDKQVAQTIAHTRRATRGLSSAAIRRELSRKGIAQEICDQVLSEFAAEDELATARLLALKRAGSMRNLEAEVRKRRLLGFLARKGYPGSIAFAAIKHAEQELAK